MNLRIHIHTWLPLLLTSALFTACSDDDAPAMKPALPANGGSNVKSVTHLGSVPATYDWQFTYSDGRLVRASGTSRDPSPEIDKNFSYTSNISYGPSSVKVSNSSGERISLTLGSSGLVEQMTVNGNIYEFYYRDLRLAGWKKTIFEDSFGHITQYRSSATIEYADGDLSRIVYSEDGLTRETLTFTPSNLVNTNGLLPELAAKQLGLLGFEHLYYAGLFGRPTVHLVQALHVEDLQDAGRSFTVDFDYTQRNGNYELCNYRYQGKAASVSYEY